MNVDFSTIPSSVYRMQLNPDFPLKQAIKVLPYLNDLGIEGIYLSPFYDAYSAHGYDVTDPNRLNPKLGKESDFLDFCKELKKWGLKLIIDVVPNHMGFQGGNNKWWQDVLENGPYSEYANFFDIDWNPEKQELQDKVLLPILGDTYGSVLERQEIKLQYLNGQFALHYADYPFPLAPHTYPFLLEKIKDKSTTRKQIQGKDLEKLDGIIQLYQSFPVTYQERREKKQEGLTRLKALIQSSKILSQIMSKTIAEINGKKRDPSSFDALDTLIDAQFYRLSYWRVAHHEINYRRFFNIHELVAIRIEEQMVLEAHHKWVFELIRQGIAQGLRIDHPDGLFDPVRYFERIKSQFPIYIVVEKILDRKESLPDSWKVEGTVGYEYLNVLNGLFICQDNEKEMSDIYEEFIGKKLSFESLLYEKKKLFTLVHMVSEVEALGLMLDRLSEKGRYYRDFTRHDLTEALQEVIAFFPVYRSYIRQEGGVTKRDIRYLTIAIEKARRKAHTLDPSIFDFLEKLLLLKLKLKKEEYERYRDFILRFQQLTAPIMAKGLEDTCFYIYNRFISLNEVGGDPPHFGHSIQDFHRFCVDKQKRWPYGFLATSTHDTKRSEDIRMRLNVISEMPEKWRLEVKKWALVNAKHRVKGEFGFAPNPNTEYFIYQTLVGVWPKATLKKEEQNSFRERIWHSILKSMREARQETSWMSPNHAYEEGVKHFLFAILSSQKQNHFLKYFIPFVRKIDRFGGWNSLASTVLKIASPGVVDLYQGNELLNYRLVDPDNRAPVDYLLCKQNLNAVFKLTTKKHATLLESLLKLLTSNEIGKIKLYLYWKGLELRKAHRELFLKGEYLPLRVKGTYASHIIAFARRFEDQFLVVIASRFFVTFIHNDWTVPLGRAIWGDAEVFLPIECKESQFFEVFTEREMIPRMGKGGISFRVASLFDTLPFCYLLN